MKRFVSTGEKPCPPQSRGFRLTFDFGDWVLVGFLMVFGFAVFGWIMMRVMQNG